MAEEEITSAFQRQASRHVFILPTKQREAAAGLISNRLAGPRGVDLAREKPVRSRESL